MAADLPDRLESPLASGEAHWHWLGGAPSLDLVNTLRERSRRRVECLVTPADLSAWLVAAGLAPPGTTAGVRDLDAARRLREAVDAAVTAVTRGSPPPAGAVAEIGSWLGREAAHPRLEVRAGTPVLVRAPAGGALESALAALALDAARLVGTPERDRLRVCASPTCAARFVDRSPAGRRRWCSMSGCGNRAKVRRHRARTAARGTGEQGP